MTTDVIMTYFATIVAFLKEYNIEATRFANLDAADSAPDKKTGHIRNKVYGSIGYFSIFLRGKVKYRSA